MNHGPTVSSLAALPSISLTSSSPARKSTSHRHTSNASVPYGHYPDYSRAFSESTAYDNSPISSAAPSLLSSSKDSGPLSRPIGTLGTKFLNALTESVRLPPTATGISRTRSLHQRAISLASFVPSLPALSAEDDEGRPTSSRSIRTFEPQSGTGRLSRPSSAHFEIRDEGQVYDNPIMEYHSSLSGGVRPPRNVHSPEQSANVIRPALAQASFRKWFSGSKRSSIPWSVDSSRRSDLDQSAMSLLCPGGDTNLQDSAALSEFLKNAEALVIRLQDTCKEQEAEMRSARRERELANEEAKEADTRVRHLRNQLEEMGRKATENQMACSSLAEELASERSRRAEDMERTRRVRGPAPGEKDTQHRTKRYPSRVSADGSNSILSIASDSGFESDYPDTETDGTNEPMSPPGHSPTQRYQQWHAPCNHSDRPESSGSSRDAPRQVDSAVWSWMQQEKLRLERRVQELEGIVENCLDLVSHV